MRPNAAHGLLRRFATTCFVVGILALLSTPLALAQSTDDAVNGRATESLAEACPEGFVLSQDKQACFAMPVVITSQAPVACELGFISEDASVCYTFVNYIAQAPTSELEIIDATVVSNAEPAPGQPLPSGLFCPNTYELIDVDGTPTCSAMVTPSDLVVAPVTVTEGGFFTCPDDAPERFGELCAAEGATLAPGDFRPGEPGVPAIPGIAAVPPFCPSGTDSSIVVDGLCALLGATPLPTLPDGTCGSNEISTPSSYASGGIETKVCLPALAQTPGIAGVPATPAIPATPDTCNGIPTASPASECVVPSNSVPATFVPPTSLTICPAGSRPAGDARGCVAVQPDVKVRVEPTLVSTNDTVTCPSGYDGPSLSYECTRTILTAQPDIPVCKAGTLLNTGASEFVCLLENRPVAPAPTTSITCPVGDLDQDLQLCIWELDTEPVIGTGPQTDTVPVSVRAVGDPSAAPLTWRLDLASTCADTTSIDILSADTFEFASAFQEVPVEAADEAGVACTYTLTAQPVAGWQTSLPPAGIQFTPATTGVPFIFVEFNQDNVGELRIFKEIIAEAMSVPATVEFTVSGLCLEEPRTAVATVSSTFPTARAVVTVPLTDALGNACVYNVTHAPIPGIDSANNGAQVIMASAVAEVRFTKVQQDLEFGTLRLYVSAEGDRSQAPANWEFIVTATNGCLDEPATVSISTAATFDGPVSADVALPTFNDERGARCDYNVARTPADGFVHIDDGLYFFDFVEGPVVEFSFRSTELATGTGTMSVFIESRSEAIEATVTVESSCLDGPRVAQTNSGSLVSADLNDLPLVGADGALCEFDLSVAAPGVFFTTTPSLNLRNGIAFVNVRAYEPNSIGELVIAKRLAFAAELELPDVWEFTLTSPCFDPIVVTMPGENVTSQYGDSLTVSVPVTDASGFCEITVTETPVAGFAMSAPVPQPAGQRFLFSEHAKVPADAGLLGDLTIDIAPEPGTDLPDVFEYALASPCLDEALTIVVPTSGYALGAPINTFVSNLPLDADGQLCSYELTAFAVAGLDQAGGLPTPHLNPTGQYVLVRVAPDGAFGADALAEIPPVLQPRPTATPTPNPIPGAPTPTPTPNPIPGAPTATPDAGPMVPVTPVPTPADGATPTPVPAAPPATATPDPGVVVIAGAPATSSGAGSIATAATTNFGGIRPTTPANFFGSTASAKSVSPVQALAHTGGNAAPLGLFGILMILVGSMATLIARRDEPQLVADPFWNPGIDK